MVLAYHLILTAYGFWLPNDPRGSGSDFVRAVDLYRTAGKATPVNTRQSVANKPHDHAARENAKQALAHPPVIFNGQQARAVALGLADYCTRNQRTCFACAVMPDHAHLVLKRTDLSIEKQAEQLKARATTFLNKQDLHPFHAQTSRRPTDAGLSTSLEVWRPASVGRRLLPSPWSRHAWQVYLNTPDAIHRAIRYVEQNPIKAGYKPQRYPWVTHYTG